MKKLVFEFSNVAAAEHFKLWLCESGEQSYWDWMMVRESEEDGNITATRFNYEFRKDHKNCDIVKALCSRLDKP